MPFRHTHRNRSAYAQVSAAPRRTPRIPARAGLAHAQSGLALKVHRTFIHYQPHGFAVRSRICRDATAAFQTCKNLDLRPVNHRFLQVELTKNSFACRPPNYAVLPKIYTTEQNEKLCCCICYRVEKPTGLVYNIRNL